MPKVKAEELFMTAIGVCNGADRDSYLRNACGDDSELRRQVEELLAAHAQSHGPLDAPHPSITGTTDLHQPEQVGDQIGPYKLLQVIGEGGFGVVYMAEQREPVRRNVAVKVIKPGMDTREVIARFEAERQALSMMQHPNIAQVLDAGSTDQGRPYFVMELVKGVPITEYADKNQLSTRDRLQLFTVVCRAIQHAHHKGIIHRDVKPSNVMVTLDAGQPIVKVIDFGVSKALNQKLTERTLFTAYGQMVGTPQYMSPEQAEMSGLDIDTRSDVYSLGVLLFELLTGTTPLEGGRLREAGYAEMLRIIREEEAPRLSARLSTLGERLTIVAKARGTEPKRLCQLLRGELDWIVLRALEKDRNRRYESASGIAADVDRYLNDEAVEACPPSLLYKASKVVRRHRGRVAVAAVLLLVTGGGIFEWARSTAAARQANDRLLETTKDAAFIAVMGGDLDAAQKLLKKAEQLGVDASWAHRTWGHLHLLNGEIDDALRELGVATNIDPQSLPARALLSRAIHVDGHEGRGYELAWEIQATEAKTVEDYLYKGIALGFIEPQAAYESLDQAVALNPLSLIARMYRAQFGVNVAMNLQSETLIQEATHDIDSVLTFMPDYPEVLGRHAQVHLAAAMVYKQSGKLEQFDREMAAARQSVTSLQRFRESERGRFTTLQFYECAREFENLVETERGQSRGASERQEITFHLAAELLARGQATAAMTAFRRSRPTAQRENKWLEVIIRLHLSEDPEAIRAEFEDYVRNREVSVYSVAFDWPTLRLLNSTVADDVAKRAKTWAKENDKPGYGYYYDYMLGARSDQETTELLEMVAASQRRLLCHSHFSMGVDRLVSGRRADAARHFEKAVESGFFKYRAFTLSRVFLQLLEQDPNWPQWLLRLDDKEQRVSGGPIRDTPSDVMATKRESAKHTFCIVGGSQSCWVRNGLAIRRGAWLPPTAAPFGGSFAAQQ